MIKISEQLKAIRKAAGFTQEDVAEKLCITRQALSNWEQGKTIPDLYMFAQLAAIYHFSPDEFLLVKASFKGTTNMKMNFSEAQIECYIQKWYPTTANLTPLSGGLVSQTYSFTADGKKYVFQIGGSQKAYEKERYIGAEYSGILPFREVLHIQETNDGIAFCISRYMEGCGLDKLNERERREIIGPVIDIIDKMGRITIPADMGFGFFDAGGYARYPTWVDFVSAVDNENVFNWSTLTQKGMDDTAIKKAIRKVRENIAYADLKQAGLVLGDLNVLADNGRVTGLIDCDFALYGDPLYCVASLLFWDVIKTRDITAAVVRHYLTDETSNRRAYCYILRYALEEIYSTVILDEIGYDVRWVCRRLDELLTNGLCHTELSPV